MANAELSGAEDQTFQYSLVQTALKFRIEASLLEQLARCTDDKSISATYQSRAFLLMEKRRAAISQMTEESRTSYNY